MPINVSEALDSDTAIKVTVFRKTVGAYVDGIYVPGVESSFTCLASPQQPTPRDLENLAEGERDRDPFLFICNKQIRTVSDRDGYQADEILFKGNRYKVVGAKDWITFGHSTVIAVRVI